MSEWDVMELKSETFPDFVCWTYQPVDWFYVKDPGWIFHQNPRGVTILCLASLSLMSTNDQDQPQPKLCYPSRNTLWILALQLIPLVASVKQNTFPQWPVTRTWSHAAKTLFTQQRNIKHNLPILLTKIGLAHISQQNSSRLLSEQGCEQDQDSD